MTSEFQSFQNRKNFGMDKLKRKKYEEAKQDFQYVVDNIFVDNDTKAALKMTCCNQIAFCCLELSQIDEAIQACNESNKVYLLMRPPTKTKKTSKNDILNFPYHTYFIRLGQIEEKRQQYHKALQMYQEALKAYPKGDASQFMSDCLFNFGIPSLNADDPAIQPFGKIYYCIFDITKLFGCYQECIDSINHHPPTPEEIKKIDQAGVVQMIIGLANFLLIEAGNPNIDPLVEISLKIAYFFIKGGAVRVWSNIQGLIEIINAYKENKELLICCSRILLLYPVEKYKIFGSPEFLHIWSHALNMENITVEEKSSIFKIIYYILNIHRPLIDSLQDTNVFEIVLQTHTDDSFILLSLLVMSDYFAKKSQLDEIVEWANTSIEKHIESASFLQLCLIIVNRLLIVPENNENFNFKNYIESAFSSICQIVMRQKFESILEDAYIVLARMVKYVSKEKVHDTKIIRLTSLHLASHMKLPEFEIRLLDFLYNCSLVPHLVDELTVVEPLLPTVMKILNDYPNQQLIVEFSISLAVTMNHPNKESLLRAGLLQFPESTKLKQHIDLLKRFLDK